MKNIFLIGMMGSGKSTLAPLLSKSLNLPYIDTDNDLMEILDMDMKTIFSELGEKKFRLLESVYFNEHISKDQKIYALGGGIVLEKNNQIIIKDKGISIFLDASVNELQSRLRNNLQDRPLINADDLKKSITNIYKNRFMLYQSISDYKIDSNDKSIAEIHSELLDVLHKYV